MKPNDNRPAASRDQDLLEKYVSGVNGFYLKLERIAANQQALADSLNRAAAALRSIGAARKAGSLPPPRLVPEPGVQ